MSSYVRGNVYFVDTDFGTKPYLIVSNNARNKAFDSAIAVRITTTAPKRPRPSIVPLSNNDPLVGFVLCDSIATLWDDEPAIHSGALSPTTMYNVAEGLKAAFAIP